METIKLQYKFSLKCHISVNLMWLKKTTQFCRSNFIFHDVFITRIRHTIKNLFQTRVPSWINKFLCWDFSIKTGLIQILSMVSSHTKYSHVVFSPFVSNWGYNFWYMFREWYTLFATAFQHPNRIIKHQQNFWWWKPPPNFIIR